MRVTQVRTVEVALAVRVCVVLTMVSHQETTGPCTTIEPSPAKVPPSRARRAADARDRARLRAPPRQLGRDGCRAARPPSTARYRVARLRELLGDQLDDPDSRFELEIALRAA